MDRELIPIALAALLAGLVPLIIGLIGSFRLSAATAKLVREHAMFEKYEADQLHELVIEVNSLIARWDEIEAVVQRWGQGELPAKRPT